MDFAAADTAASHGYRCARRGIDRGGEVGWVWHVVQLKMKLAAEFTDAVAAGGEVPVFGQRLPGCPSIRFGAKTQCILPGAK